MEPLSIKRYNSNMTNDKKFIEEATIQAKESFKKGGFPAGAVVVKDNKVISRGVSLGASLNDPTSHAEICAVREACKALETTDLSGCVLYSSMEPCLMCFSAANWAGISKTAYACKRTKKMITDGYYEGNADNLEINQLNNKKTDIVFVPGFEDEVMQVIGDWEKANG